MYIFVLLREPH